ncbi:MAG: discoidin domain-containing protein, partial [Armatimonadetes bacterium]|nr:discoidin domain-containing protein [Armatimonadota bacterium]
YMKVQLSIIGEGFVANIDHSPTIQMPYKTLYESAVMQAHRKMAEWANPPGLPSLTESYTNSEPGPLEEAAWGYNTINLSRKVIYVHLLANPYGKSGKPAAPTLTVGPVARKVVRVIWMNRGTALRFQQEGDRLTLHLTGVVADPIDTLLKIQLDGPLPRTGRDPSRKTQPLPPGNLATHKPARLLSLDGSHTLIASGFAFARYGVDGKAETHAQGAYEWAWTYEVDLLSLHPLRRVVIHFAKGGYATEYNVLLSEEGKTWKEVAHVDGCTGGTREHRFDLVRARFIRIQAVKPDGPNQVGAQMGIAELEVYE